MDVTVNRVGRGVAGMAGDAFLEAGLRQLVKKVAFLVESYAKHYAPVKTGRLMGSIYVEFLNPLLARVVTMVHYGLYQEYGTSRHGAHPFMRPAAKRVKSELGGLVKTTVREAYN